MEATVLNAVESQLGPRIRAAREGAHLSVEELAARAGVAAEEVEATERGDSLSTSTLERIALATGCRVDWLLRPDQDTFDVLLRAGDGTPAETRAAIDLLAKFTADYEFLISLGE
jgi:transcriptional regulator with XRE-family HTH domain